MGDPLFRSLFIMIQEVLLNLLIIIRGYEAFVKSEMKTLNLEFDQGHRKIRKSFQLHLNLKRYVNIFFNKKKSILIIYLGLWRK